MTDIRDLKPLVDAFPWELVWLGLFLLLATLTVLWGVSRKPTTAPLKNRKTRSFRQRLDLLKHKNLSPSQRCEALGEIMHDFLRLHYGIPCHRLTTLEIIAELRRKEAPDSLLDPLCRLLEACDLVKFAKWQPEAADIAPHLTSAEWILENSREVPA